MSRRKKRKNKSEIVKRSSAAGRWWNALGDDGRKAIARKCRNALVWLVVIASCAWGMSALERRVVVRSNIPPVSVRVRLCDRPEWMPDELAREIAASILPGQADLNDWNLTEKAYRAAAANPWIRKVNRVTKRVADETGAGVLEIHAEYRKPVAQVLIDNDRSFVYVSGDGCRLPDEVPRWVAWVPARGGRPGRKAYFLCESDVPPEFKAVEVHYMAVKGVSGSVPKVGRRWESRDIIDALRLVRLFWDRPYARQIAEVDVRNFNWRASRHNPQLRLIARKNDTPETVILFGRFPNSEGDWIVTPQRKIANLDIYVRNHRGTLAGLARKIDIRRDRLTYIPY